MCDTNCFSGHRRPLSVRFLTLKLLSLEDYSPVGVSTRALNVLQQKIEREGPDAVLTQARIQGQRELVEEFLLPLAEGIP